MGVVRVVILSISQQMAMAAVVTNVEKGLAMVVIDYFTSSINYEDSNLQLRRGSTIDTKVYSCCKHSLTIVKVNCLSNAKLLRPQLLNRMSLGILMIIQLINSCRRKHDLLKEHARLYEDLYLDGSMLFILDAVLTSCLNADRCCFRGTNLSFHKDELQHCFLYQG